MDRENTNTQQEREDLFSQIYSFLSKENTEEMGVLFKSDFIVKT